MSDTAAPVFSPSGQMQGNLTSSQGQPPAAAPPLAPQSPLATMGPPPAPPAPPNYPQLNIPPRPAIPTEKQLGPAPDARDYQKGAMEFASAMAIIGAVAGRFTRQPGGAALGAFAAALKGWKEGNLQAYTDAANKWEQDTKATITNNKQELEHYRLVLEDRNININDQMSQIQMIATKYHNDLMYNAANSKNYTMVGQLYEKNWEYTNGEKGVEATAAPLIRENKEITEKLKNTALKMASGQIPIDTDTQGNPLPMNQILNNRFILERFGPPPQKGVTPQQLALNRFLEENPNASAQQIAQFNAQSRPARSAAAMSLQKFLQENPDATSADIQAFQAKQTELSAAARTAGVRETNLDIILRVTNSAIPAALEASEKVPRGQFVPLNQIIQKGKIATSDTNLMQFGMANLQLAEGWARAMNPTGVMRESDRDLALQFLSTATSKETYKALVEQLRTQIQRERAAIQSGTQQTISAPGQTAQTAPAAAGGGWGKAEVVQ